MDRVLVKLQLQAKACRLMGSPFTAELMEAAIADYCDGGSVQQLLDTYPECGRPGVHLAGAVQYLALTGDSVLSRHYPSVGGDGDAYAAWSAARTILDRDREHFETLFILRLGPAPD